MHRGFLLVTAASMLLSPAAATAAKKAPGKQPSGPVRAAQTTVKVNGNGGTTGTATATCPKGTVPIAGGWNSPSSVRQSFITVYASTRSGKRSWTVSGVINGFVTPPATQWKLNLTAYAYCRTGSPLKSQTKTLSLTLAQNNFTAATATAKCPKGTIALSGGFRIPIPNTSTAGWVHQSSRQSARSWSMTTTAVTANNTPSMLLQTIAYCAPGAAAPATRKTTVPAPPSDSPPGAFPPTPGAPPTVAKSPKCGGGLQMISGGFRSPSVTVPPPGSSTIPFVYESRRLGNAGPWKTSMFNPGVNPTTLTSTGYCA
jgi:hypothetical protein